MSETKGKWWVNKILEKFVEMGFVEPVTKRNRSQDVPAPIAKEGEKEKEKEIVKYPENLQTVFNVSEKFPHLFKELFSKMKNIGVLYMGRWEPTVERHIMEKEKMEFLAGLENLRRLRACHNLEELPKEVGSLKILTHLDLSECFWIDIIPKQLSHLSNPKVLKGFVINKISPCTLRNLTKLSNLAKLSIYVKDDDFSLDETATLFSKFGKLQKLKIEWEKPTTSMYNTKIRGSKHQNQ
ncbi:hypothetical protein V6N11_034502 [Hibiscus sabdariffa]|uniref:Disease resistance R13L4/SHOC-2-like LRR domain-containing protein n=1 Tax=Hibiscus sabdariffa TaxID=183260 RepID=A0ABR1ZYW0_9ROSI